MTGVHDPAPATPSSSLLVGRAIERAIIDALLRDAERGVAAAVLFAGPAGIGKSALVDYAVDVASDFRVVRIVGVESEMTFGYTAVHQLALHLPTGACVADVAAEPCPPPVRIGAPWRRHHGPNEDADEYVRRLSLLPDRPCPRRRRCRSRTNRGMSTSQETPCVWGSR